MLPRPLCCADRRRCACRGVFTHFSPHWAHFPSTSASAEPRRRRFGQQTIVGQCSSAKWVIGCGGMARALFCVPRNRAAGPTEGSDL
jgi:hypothetical protein